MKSKVVSIVLGVLLCVSVVFNGVQFQKQRSNAVLVNAVNTDLSALNDQITALNAKIDEQSATITALNKQIETAKADSEKALAEKEEALTKLKADMEQALAEKDKAIEEKDKTIEELKQELEEWKNKEVVKSNGDVVGHVAEQQPTETTDNNNGSSGNESTGYSSDIEAIRNALLDDDDIMEALGGVGPGEWEVSGSQATANGSDAGNGIRLQ